MAGKYEPLNRFLRGVPARTREVLLSFDEIEAILRAQLPHSAMTYRPWWGNQKNTANRPQAHAWLAAGFVVDMVNQVPGSARVRFKRG